MRQTPEPPNSVIVAGAEGGPLSRVATSEARPEGGEAGGGLLESEGAGTDAGLIVNGDKDIENRFLETGGRDHVEEITPLHSRPAATACSADAPNSATSCEIR